MVEVDEDEVELEFVPPPPQDMITEIVKIRKRYLICFSPEAFRRRLFVYKILLRC